MQRGLLTVVILTVLFLVGIFVFSHHNSETLKKLDGIEAVVVLPSHKLPAGSSATDQSSLAYVTVGLNGSEENQRIVLCADEAALQSGEVVVLNWFEKYESLFATRKPASR